MGVFIRAHYTPGNSQGGRRGRPRVIDWGRRYEGIPPGVIMMPRGVPGGRGGRQREVSSAKGMGLGRELAGPGPPGRFTDCHRWCCVFGVWVRRPRIVEARAAAPSSLRRSATEESAEELGGGVGPGVLRAFAATGVALKDPGGTLPWRPRTGRCHRKSSAPVPLDQIRIGDSRIVYQDSEEAKVPAVSATACPIPPDETSGRRLTARPPSATIDRDSGGRHRCHLVLDPTRRLAFFSEISSGLCQIPTVTRPAVAPPSTIRSCPVT